MVLFVPENSHVGFVRSGEFATLVLFVPENSHVGFVRSGKFATLVLFVPENAHVGFVRSGKCADPHPQRGPRLKPFAALGWFKAGAAPLWGPKELGCWQQPSSPGPKVGAAPALNPTRVTRDHQLGPTLGGSKGADISLRVCSQRGGQFVVDAKSCVESGSPGGEQPFFALCSACGVRSACPSPSSAIRGAMRPWTQNRTSGRGVP